MRQTDELNFTHKSDSCPKSRLFHTSYSRCRMKAKRCVCVCCGMWRWWGKGLVCMTSSPKYVFSLHSASFLPSLSCLSPCVFVCLCVCFILSLYSDSCVCWCLNMLFAAVTLSYMLCYIRACLRERDCVCVCVCVCTSAEICLFIRLQVFEEVTPGGSHYVSACPLQVGRQSDIYHQRISAGPEDTKLAHSLWLGKVFAETNLTKMCTLQRVLK